MTPKRTCILCSEPIKPKQTYSSFRVAGEIKGFQRNIDLEKSFHNDCITREEGVNEIERAQVLDYLEAVEFNKSVIDDLKGHNLERAKKLMREILWREKYEPPPKA